MAIGYTIREDYLDQINREFVDFYDYKYWLFRLKTNRKLVENLDEFVDVFGDETLQEESLESYRLTLQSEIVYDFFHTTEALFALFIANRVSEIPWRKIRHLGVRLICEFIREMVLDEGLDDEDIRFAFYRGTGERAHEEDDDLRESIEFINTYLETVGDRFLDHELYNHYKHGLRVYATRKSVTITSEETEDPLLDKDGSAHIYLDSEQISKEGKDEVHQLVKVTEWFDYEDYYKLCLVNYQLIQQMFQSLQQNYRGGDDEGMIDVTLFDYEIDELFGGSDFRLTERQKYPVGEKIYELGGWRSLHTFPASSQQLRNNVRKLRVTIWFEV